MKTALVGYTGFVGSNLAFDFHFDGLYNSKNISDSYQSQPDLLIYAGIRAEKFLANANPEMDLNAMQNAIENIQRIKPKKLLLISTIDVYNSQNGVDERTEIDTTGLQPYGANRCYLENQIRSQYPKAIILRLPALFGRGLKKNFIFDYIHRIPTLLNSAKMAELSQSIPDLHKYYHLQENGFYKCSRLDTDSEKKLRNQFNTAGFTALKFTDSRSSFQFYNLNYLWKDICRILEIDVPLINIATEPINVSDLYQYLSGGDYVNHCSSFYPEYNIKSIYSDQMGGKDGYLYPRSQIMGEIKHFIEQEKAF